MRNSPLLLLLRDCREFYSNALLSAKHWIQPYSRLSSLFRGNQRNSNGPNQLATRVWLTHCQGATEGADGQVAFMRQLHESSFSVGGSELLRTALQPSLAEWNHKGRAGHYGTACVTSSTYYRHILSPFISISSLALCRVSCSDFIEFKSVKSHCWGQMENSHTPLTPSHIRQGLQSIGIHDLFFLVCWWICKMSLIFLASLPNPPFLNSGWPPLLFFMMCSQGERPATPLSWVALNAEKKRGRKIRACSFP